MIVTAALAWFDETPEDLYRYVTALPVVCDRLVAVDGGYERYPGAQRRSSVAEDSAIVEAADACGIEFDLVLPDQVWAGQVAKRSFLYARAAERSDWIVLLDADHILHGVREAVRHELQHTTEDAIEVEFYTTMNHDRPLEQTASTAWHERLAGTSVRHRMIFRALPGMRVERFHWYLSALRGDRRVWLTSVTEGPHEPVEAHRLEAPFLIEHRCLFRRDRNIVANREFCNDRAAIVASTGQEDAQRRKVPA